MNVQEKQQFLESWEKTQRRGILVYVLITAISWGTFSAIFIRLFMTVVDQGFSWEVLCGAFYSREFLVTWAVFLFGGLFYALTMWFYFNQRYRKLRAATNEATAEEQED